MFVCIFAAVVSFAQSPKSLLWRISGKGLKEPSYLYGTMHISNKEVFRFGDSVYKAIERSQGLAIEVNPDEMAAEIVQAMSMKKNDGVRIYDKMDRKEFDSYRKGLSEKFNKDAEEITTEDILKEKNKWIQEYMMKGEMPTFMDAFLYNIARKQGKWIGGIEDLADQTSLHEDLFDKSDLDILLADQKMADVQRDKSIDEMISIYLSEDIDRLLNYSGSDREKDIVLTRRNVKMARRMDSLSAIRTMFFAVGAAHLAGDSGVINLLRKRGFTVDPVFSSSKLDASKYKYREIQLPWINVDHPRGFYSVSMPMKPADVKLEGLIDSKLLMDLFTSTGYFTFSIASNNISQNSDSLLKGLARNMFPQSKILKSQKIQKDGLTGREISSEIENGFIRIQAMIYRNIVFLNMIYTFKKSNLNSVDSDKFFSSFKINKKQIDAMPVMYPFRDNMIGISIEGPGEWSYSQEYSNKKDQYWDIDSYTSVDDKEGAYNFLMVKQPRISRFISSDSAMYRDLLDNMKEKFPNLQMKDTMVSGLSSVIIYGDNIDDENHSLRIISTIRGNKNVVLTTVAARSYFSSDNYQRMHQSFQWIPARKIHWKPSSDSVSRFRTWAPEDFKNIIGENGIIYSSYDSAYSTSYSVTLNKINKYEWSNSEADYWKEKVDGYYDEDDRVISVTETTNGRYRGREVLIGLGKSTTKERIRVFVAGDQIVTLFVSSSGEEVLQENVNRFMNDFRLLEQPASFNMFSNKTDLLLKDLDSGDSLVREEAMGMITNVPFKETDLPALKKAYLETFKNSRETKLKILDGISNIKSEKSFRTIFELLKTSPVAESLNFTARNNFSDTLSMMVKFLPEFNKLADNIYHGPFVANMMNRFLDSGYIRNKELLAYEPKLLSLVGKLMPVWNHPDSSYDYHCYTIVELLPKINTDASINTLKKMQTVAYPYFKKVVAVKLAKFNIRPEAYVIDSLMSNKHQRIDFYDEMKEAGKLSWIPARFLVQREFADGYIQINSENDDYDTESIEFLEDRVLTVNDKKYRFYLYRVTYITEDSLSSYLGVAGGFDPLSGSVELTGNFCQMLYDDLLTEENMENLISKMLEGLKD
jgi:uncharacterized protein YbaP (TraB family)